MPILNIKWYGGSLLLGAIRNTTFTNERRLYDDGCHLFITDELDWWVLTCHAINSRSSPPHLFILRTYVKHVMCMGNWLNYRENMWIYILYFIQQNTWAESLASLTKSLSSLSSLTMRILKMPDVSMAHSTIYKLTAERYKKFNSYSLCSISMECGWIFSTAVHKKLFRIINLNVTVYKKCVGAGFCIQSTQNFKVRLYV